MLKIVLFGAAGQVGSDCHTALVNTGYDVVAITRQQLDFANAQAVADCVRQAAPALVINACAYTAVDKAEQDQLLADKVNHHSVEALAICCAEQSVPLIHLSTDYVFDGTASSPYTEDAPVAPLGVYGASKLAGERAIRQRMDAYIILRTSWVFGEQGNNFVKTMLRVGATRAQLKVVNDQRGRPSYVGDIVKTLLFFVRAFQADGHLPWGVYHCSSGGETSWYDFACAIFEEAQRQAYMTDTPSVIAIPSSDYPTPAPRPAYSVLDTQKLTRLMGQALPHWRQGLQQLIYHLVNPA
ncbi:MAG: dTDP-4-dehydrorhamnose reductase [Cellvibrionaceae bacterium]|nr:dTDP-4-dehydrorhamnose reductase [Cellvibrionaceae bacterium]